MSTNNSTRSPSVSTPEKGRRRLVHVSMANTNPLLLRLFVDWLRRNFDIDEDRLRARLYLHHGLDLEGATAFWSAATSIPEHQFQRPYRAVRRSESSTRKARTWVSDDRVPLFGHPPTCDGQRRGDNLSVRPSGIAQLAEQLTVNQWVAGSSPAPGADGCGPSSDRGSVSRFRTMRDLGRLTRRPMSWIVMA